MLFLLWADKKLILPGSYSTIFHFFTLGIEFYKITTLWFTRAASHRQVRLITRGPPSLAPNEAERGFAILTHQQTHTFNQPSRKFWNERIKPLTLSTFLMRSVRLSMVDNCVRVWLVHPIAVSIFLYDLIDYYEVHNELIGWLIS